MGVLMFPSTESARDTRSKAAGVCPSVVLSNTLLYHGTRIMNLQVTLRDAKTLSAAKKVAAALGRSAPL
jgi:hypothetical protein